MVEGNVCSITDDQMKKMMWKEPGEGKLKNLKVGSSIT
jgi:hypothetical protein